MEFNYLVERTRMLNSLGRKTGGCVGVRCEDCPLSVREFTCEQLEADYPLEATEIVRKWAEKHPRKTRKDVLLEKFPNAMLMKDGTPYSCCEALGIAVKTECEEKRCSDCWNKEVEE